MKMLQCDRTDVSEGFDINRTSTSKECDICHYWYFKDVGFKYEPCICIGCHDISMITYELKNITILNVRGVNYRCTLWSISENVAVNILNNSVLKDKGVL